MRRMLPLLIALSVAAAIGLNALAVRPQAQVAITIVDFAFEPPTLTIGVGDTVL